MLNHDKTLSRFGAELASSSPSPGGGGAAALAGALAAALGGMVVSLTVGKPKYAANEEALRAIGEKAETARGELLEMIDADAEAFAPLARAYSLPRDTADRDKILEEALLRAAAAPARIAELCCEVVELLEGCASMGSLLVLSDAASGAALAEGALRAAVINVKVNTALMRDHNRAAALNARMDDMEKEYAARAAAIRRSLGY
ncbi:MAG: cyclodeaminase/cyclohydrolase family protein [Oscillospiraceae bacterium]|nr:cyclodeaminase/cyclohydrolase family protein [Oscillospiraceae bacterium]